MNILQICNKSPFPPKEGGSIAMYNLTEGLIDAGHSVEVIAISTKKYFIEIEKIPIDYLKKTSFSSVYIDTSFRLKDMIINLFSTKSYNVQRFDSIQMHTRLKEILQDKKFDIIQLETLYVGPYIATIRKYSNARIVLRAHNIEHLIWKRYADNIINPIKKLYLLYLTAKLKNFENYIFKLVDGIVCISDVDTGFVKKSEISTPIVTISFGMKNPVKCMENKFIGNLTFFHLGSMDWKPNQEGVKWFLDFCMPLISKLIPNNKILLAGRNMPRWVYNYHYSNLEVIGEVDKADEFISKNDIMFVPLFSGSGVRIKIVEGLSKGKVIISTTLGAEGIDCIDGENILIADTKEQFIEKFLLCIQNIELCRSISSNAYSLFQNQHDIVDTTQRLIKFYKRINKIS